MQLRVLGIRQPQVATLQLVAHCDGLVVDGKYEDDLVPRRLYEHRKSGRVPLPLGRNSLVRMVVGEYNGGKED
jgi:hypothetical protein